MANTPTNKQDSTTRRGFGVSLFRFAAAAAGALAAVLVAVPMVSYLLGPLRRRADPWIHLGPLGRFPVGQTRLATFDNPLGQPWDGVTSQTGVYVRNQGPGDDGKDRVLVFAVNCAHLGCPVDWFPQSGLFLCPCHGGVYYENGARASGPPPRGLYHCEWRVRAGRLEIRAPHYPTLQNTLTENS